MSGFATRCGTCTLFPGLYTRSSRIRSSRGVGGPVRGPLLDECRDALLRNVVDHVACHRLTGELVGGGDPQLQLAIEQGLAARNHRPRLGYDRSGHLVDLSIEPLGRYAAVDQAAL